MQQRIRLTIVYDHRVMDGRCVARCLNTVEQILCQQVLAELGGAAMAPRLSVLAGRNSTRAA